MADLHTLIQLPRVWARLADVEVALAEACAVGGVGLDETFLDEVTNHLREAGGKRFRPIMTLLAAHLGDPERDEVVQAAVACELIHLGSLYHDDVIDEADTRRGAPAANAKWSNTVAILGGDYLLAMASDIGAGLGTVPAQLLARTFAALVRGEALELTTTYDLDTPLQIHLQVIELKTSSLISTAARLGAMMAGCSAGVVDAVSDYAGHVGTVFQMADDLLDLLASTEQLGKPAGLDVAEGVYTFAFLHALGSPAGAELRRLAERGDTIAAMPRIRAVLHETGSIDAARHHALEHLGRAHDALLRLPAGRVRDTLDGMGRFLLEQVPQA